MAFKVQKYHSVYEYPKETMELSPAISEPKLLSQTLEKFIEAQQQEPPTPITPSTGSFVKNDDLISQDIDGFMISSSARPFHTGYQFQAQCNTWPGDQGDFSWSQYQVIKQKLSNAYQNINIFCVYSTHLIFEYFRTIKTTTQPTIVKCMRKVTLLIGPKARYLLD